MAAHVRDATRRGATVAVREERAQGVPAVDVPRVERRGLHDPYGSLAASQDLAQARQVGVEGPHLQAP